MGASVAGERLDPLRSFVEAMQDVFPREPNTPVDLNRTLARGHGGRPRVGLCRGDRYRGSIVALGNAPRGPVGERTSELGGHVRIRDLMGDGLIGAYRLVELFAFFCMS